MSIAYSISTDRTPVIEASGAITFTVTRTDDVDDLPAETLYASTAASTDGLSDNN